MSDLAILFVCITLIIIVSMICKTVKHFNDYFNDLDLVRELKSENESLRREYNSLLASTPLSFSERDEGG